MAKYNEEKLIKRSLWFWYHSWVLSGGVDGKPNATKPLAASGITNQLVAGFVDTKVIYHLSVEYHALPTLPQRIDQTHRDTEMNWN
jgi:hypothetical protein